MTPNGNAPRPSAARGFRFWLVTLAAVAGVVLTASLGRWQLARAAQKEAIQASIVERQRLPALDGRALMQARDAASPEAAKLLDRRVALQGRWLAGQTVFLDNRQMFGRPGFFVLTPLQLSPDLVVVVQRGWVPRNFEDRAALPVVPTPDGIVDVEARIASSPPRLLELSHDGGAGASQGHSVIRQNLDLVAFRAETGLPLAALSALQLGAASEGLQREWTPVTSGVERNYGYAFQWFGLCALIAFLYAWFQFVRRPRAA